MLENTLREQYTAARPAGVHTYRARQSFRSAPDELGAGSGARAVTQSDLNLVLVIDCFTRVTRSDSEAALGPLSADAPEPVLPYP